jgi:hypothetical protein
MQQEDNGPTEIAVTFQRGEAESDFRAVCTAGIPTADGGYEERDASGGHGD